MGMSIEMDTGKDIDMDKDMDTAAVQDMYTDLDIDINMVCQASWLSGTRQWWKTNGLEIVTNKLIVKKIW